MKQVGVCLCIAAKTMPITR